MLSRKEFDHEYTQHADAIYRFIYWLTRDATLSEDLVSGTFERAWRGRDSFKSGSVKAWFYRIARNLVTDHWRKKQAMLLDDVPGLSENLVGPGLSYDFDLEQEQKALTEALAKLPDNLRQVTVLRFIEGLSARKVGEILETTEGNVRVMQHRALKQLKEHMSHED